MVECTSECKLQLREVKPTGNRRYRHDGISKEVAFDEADEWEAIQIDGP